MSELLSICQEYARVWQANSREGYGHDKRAVERRDYIAIDKDNGPGSWCGVVLVRKSDGQVFDLKGYGRPNLKRPRGHIADWLAKEQAVAAALLPYTPAEQLKARSGRETGSVCEHCDAGDPTSVVPYHPSEQCPSRPRCRCGQCGDEYSTAELLDVHTRVRHPVVGMTPEARQIVILIDGVDVAAHALGATPHEPEEAWRKAKAELWEARKALIEALRRAREADLRTLDSI